MKFKTEWEMVRREKIWGEKKRKEQQQQDRVQVPAVRSQGPNINYKKHIWKVTMCEN